MVELPDVSDPWSAQYEIAEKKARKRETERKKTLGEEFGAKGRFYSGELIGQQAKVGTETEEYLSDTARQIAVERAATKSAQEYQTSERVAGQTYGTSERLGGQTYGTSERLGGQAFTTAERGAIEKFTTSERLGSEKAAVDAALLQKDWATLERIAGQTFTTEERVAVEKFQDTQAKDERTWKSAEEALGRTFTTDERTAVQNWQEAQNELDRTLKETESAADRAVTIAEIKGYFEGAEREYTLAGKEAQAAMADTAENLATAKKLGFENVSDMNSYNTNPEMARAVGIFAPNDISNIEKIIVDDKQYGWKKLMTEFGMTEEDAKAVAGYHTYHGKNIWGEEQWPSDTKPTMTVQQYIAKKRGGK